MPERIGIVEDQPLYADLLRSYVANQDGLSVAFVAHSATEAHARFRPGSVDVMILDIQLGDGDGLDLGVTMRQSDPALGILLLSSHDRLDLLLDLPASLRGGWSYLSKTGATDAAILLHAIRETAKGGVVLDPHLVESARVRRNSSIAALTVRQMQVLRLLAQGHSNSGIANRLGIKTRSVENHLNVIYAALDISRDSPDRSPRVAATLEFLRGSVNV